MLSSKLTSINQEKVNQPPVDVGASCFLSGSSEMRLFEDRGYPLLKLTANTPLLFQWFVNAERLKFKEDEIPILNTETHPYLTNVIKAAEIECNRTIGIFIGGDITDRQRKALAGFEERYHNIKIIYKDDIDFSCYDRRIKDIITDRIDYLNSQPVRNLVLLRDMENELEELLSIDENATILSEIDRVKNHSWFDMYRNLIMIKGNEIFYESDKITSGTLDESGAMLYLDMDMVLKSKLSNISGPDGISLFVMNKEGNISVENGIIWVNRKNHPVLLKGLDKLHSNTATHPYYDGLLRPLREHFNYSYNTSDHNEFCKFIEFNTENLLVNTSENVGSSWSSSPS